MPRIAFRLALDHLPITGTASTSSRATMSSPWTACRAPWRWSAPGKLNLDRCGLARDERGRLAVDEHYRTA
jgi:hypothetical protein